LASALVTAGVATGAVAVAGLAGSAAKAETTNIEAIRVAIVFIVISF
jgi:hypothetical protein